jgi:uncharacterized protein GlcG (DUF336 family)
MVQTQHATILTLDEARAMIDRGIAQAKRLRQAGAIVVVDAGGNVLSVSRMDGGPVASIAVSRAKAATAAALGHPTEGFAANAHDRPEIFAAFQSILAQPPFPGAGGMPILKNRRLVGGIATGAGIGPFNQIEGVDESDLMVDGVLANAEDLVISVALGIPYRSQHGDRRLPDPFPREDPEEAAQLPLNLAQARVYADRAIARARELNAAIGVAVVDDQGRLIQLDRMNGAQLMATEVAEAKALTSVFMQRTTTSLVEEFDAKSARLEAIQRMVPFTILGSGGGLPIRKNGELIGAIGVAGLPGPQSDDLATAALA